MDLASRYAPGGDIFDRLAASYGRDAAQRVFAAYQSGEPGAVSRILGELKHGPTGSTSTLSILAEQLATDPLGAPLESANRTLGNTVLSFLKAPWVVLLIVAALFLYFSPILRRK